jgi:hypothetical protein
MSNIQKTPGKYSDAQRARAHRQAQRVLKRVRARDAAARALRTEQKAQRASQKVRALVRRDSIRRSAGNSVATTKSKPAKTVHEPPGCGCVDPLVEALSELTDLLVETRRCRHTGRKRGRDVGLGLITKLFFFPQLRRTGFADIDAAIKDAMSDIAHRLAVKLNYGELHSVCERIAGDTDSPAWGARFTPLCSALNGATTRDGIVWCT